MGKEAKRERKKEAGETPAKQEQGFTAEDKRFAGTLNYLARGIILGGSLAVIVGWLIPEVDMGRLIGLGLLAGCLAGVTMKNINDRKQGR